MSPKLANDAVTPPYVGSVNTDMYNKPASSSFVSAAVVLAICISDIIPSCILAPPDTENIIIGNFSLMACSILYVIFSPTTAPMLPIRKPLSIIQITTSSPFILPVPQAIASSNPVFSLKAFSFLG